eukprot:Colp12_sorted_trinity150504_noHs@3901
MLSEFQQAQNLMQEKIQLLEGRYEALETRFKNRESRTEDLERIAQLEDEVAQYVVRIQKLAEDKRFFQLELINRDENFNRIFNAKPVVGTMNSIEISKKQKQQQGSSSKQKKLPPLPAFA